MGHYLSSSHFLRYNHLPPPRRIRIIAAVASVSLAFPLVAPVVYPEAHLAVAAPAQKLADTYHLAAKPILITGAQQKVDQGLNSFVDTIDGGSAYFPDSFLKTINFTIVDSGTVQAKIEEYSGDKYLIVSRGQSKSDHKTTIRVKSTFSDGSSQITELPVFVEKPDSNATKVVFRGPEFSLPGTEAIVRIYSGKSIKSLKVAEGQPDYVSVTKQDYSAYATVNIPKNYSEDSFTGQIIVTFEDDTTEQATFTFPVHPQSDLTYVVTPIKGVQGGDVDRLNVKALLNGHPLREAQVIKTVRFGESAPDWLKISYHDVPEDEKLGTTNYPVEIELENGNIISTTVPVHIVAPKPYRLIPDDTETVIAGREEKIRLFVLSGSQQDVRGESYEILYTPANVTATIDGSTLKVTADKKAIGSSVVIPIKATLTDGTTWRDNVRVKISQESAEGSFSYPLQRAVSETGDPIEVEVEHRYIPNAPRPTQYALAKNMAGVSINKHTGTVTVDRAQVKKAGTLTIPVVATYSDASTNEVSVLLSTEENIPNEKRYEYFLENKSVSAGDKKAYFGPELFQRSINDTSKARRIYSGFYTCSTPKNSDANFPVVVSEDCESYVVSSSAKVGQSYSVPFTFTPDDDSSYGFEDTVTVDQVFTVVDPISAFAPTEEYVIAPYGGSTTILRTNSQQQPSIQDDLDGRVTIDRVGDIIFTPRPGDAGKQFSTTVEASENGTVKESQRTIIEVSTERQTNYRFSYQEIDSLPRNARTVAPISSHSLDTAGMSSWKKVDSQPLGTSYSLAPGTPDWVKINSETGTLYLDVPFDYNKPNITVEVLATFGEQTVSSFFAAAIGSQSIEASKIRWIDPKTGAYEQFIIAENDNVFAPFTTTSSNRRVPARNITFTPKEALPQGVKVAADGTITIEKGTYSEETSLTIPLTATFPDSSSADVSAQVKVLTKKDAIEVRYPTYFVPDDQTRVTSDFPTMHETGSYWHATPRYSIGQGAPSNTTVNDRGQVTVTVPTDSTEVVVPVVATFDDGSALTTTARFVRQSATPFLTGSYDSVINRNEQDIVKRLKLVDSRTTSEISVPAGSQFSLISTSPKLSTVDVSPETGTIFISKIPESFTADSFTAKVKMVNGSQSKVISQKFHLVDMPVTEDSKKRDDILIPGTSPEVETHTPFYSEILKLYDIESAEFYGDLADGMRFDEQKMAIFYRPTKPLTKPVTAAILLKTATGEQTFLSFTFIKEKTADLVYPASSSHTVARGDTLSFTPVFDANRKKGDYSTEPVIDSLEKVGDWPAEAKIYGQSVVFSPTEDQQLKVITLQGNAVFIDGSKAPFTAKIAIEPAPFVPVKDKDNPGDKPQLNERLSASYPQSHPIAWNVQKPQSQALEFKAIQERAQGVIPLQALKDNETVQSVEIHDPDNEFTWASVNADTGVVTLEHPAKYFGYQDQKVPVKITYADKSQTIVTAVVPFVPISKNSAEVTYVPTPAAPGQSVSSSVPQIEVDGESFSNSNQLITFSKTSDTPEYADVSGFDGEVFVKVPEDTQPGSTLRIPVLVNFPDKSSKVVYAEFTTPEKQRTDAEKYTPAIDYTQKQARPGQTATAVISTDAPSTTAVTLSLGQNPPQGAKIRANKNIVDFTPPAGTPVGLAIIPVVVTYPDKSSETIQVYFDVKAALDNEIYQVREPEPKQVIAGESATVTVGTTAPSSATVQFALKQAIPGVTINKTTGAVTVKTQTDTSLGDVTVPVTVTYPDGSTDTATVVFTVVAPKDAVIYDATAGQQSSKVYAGKSTTVTITTTAPADKVSSFSLGDNKPAGASINSDGVVTYQAPDNAKPGTVTIPVIVTYADKSTDTFNAQITVSALPHNEKYELTAATAAEVYAGSAATATVTTTAPQAVVRSYSLGKNAPETASINASTGAVTYTAPEGMKDSSVTVPVVVTYTDGTTDTTAVSFTVKQPEPSKTAAQLYEPEFVATSGQPGSQVTAALNLGTNPANVSSFALSDTAIAAGTTLNKDTGAVTVSIPQDAKPGASITVDVIVTYTDASTDTVAATVTVTEPTVDPGDDKDKDKTAAQLYPVTAPDQPTVVYQKGAATAVVTTTAPSDKVKGFALGAAAPQGATISETGAVTFTAEAQTTPETVVDVPVVVTFADDSTTETQVQFVVKASESDTAALADKYQPQPAQESTPVKAGTAATATITGLAPASEITSLALDTKVPGAEINDQTGAVTFTPAADAASAKVAIPVVVTYKDGSSDTVDLIFAVEANKPAEVPLPTVDYGPVTVKPGKPVTISPQIEGEVVPDNATFSLTDSRAGVSIDSTTGAVTVDPSKFAPGEVLNFGVVMTVPGAQPVTTTLTVTIPKKDPKDSTPKPGPKADPKATSSPSSGSKSGGSSSPLTMILVAIPILAGVAATAWTFIQQNPGAMKMPEALTQMLKNFPGQFPWKH